MKRHSVWIVSIDEPLFYGCLYRRLIESDPGSIAGAIILPSLLNQNKGRLLNDVWYRFRFWGLRGFLYILMRMLRARLRKTGDFAGVARQHRIPVVRASTLDEAVMILKANNAEVVVATVANKISQADLDAVPGGWVNTHCGPLPRYAGVDAPFWCMYHGEPNLTVTLHYMRGEYDAGPIISQASIPNDSRPYFPLLDELLGEALTAHRKFVRTCTPTIAQAREQDPAMRSYFGTPPVAKGREFRSRGGRFI
jgi:folate-dependent phosphoribosylglycinamide formyltransferase PurN